MSDRKPYIRLHDTGEGLPRVLAPDRPPPVDQDGKPIGTVYRVDRAVAKTRVEAAACVQAFKRIDPAEIKALLELQPARLNDETRRTLAVEIEEALHA